MDKSTYEALLDLSVNQFTSNTACRKGVKLSKEHCMKISIGLKGRIKSEQHKINLSIANAGNKPTNYARQIASITHKEVPKSEAHKAKIGMKNSKKIQTPNGIYKSIDDAAAAYNVTRSSVHKWLKNANKGFCYADAASNLRRIQTPKGIFSSIVETAAAFNVTKGTVHTWLNNNKDGFSRVE